VQTVWANNVIHRPAGNALLSRQGSAKWNELPTFLDWGSTAAKIQDAIDWCSSNGYTLRGTSGLYSITGPIYAKSNLNLVMDPDCILQRAYTQAGTTGLLQNADMTIKITNVRILGGRIKNTDSTTFKGNQVCLNGDDIHIDGLEIDEWGSTSRAMLLAGDRMRLSRIRAVSLDQGGGIRLIGGDQFKCSDSHVKCGDDAYNFVPGGTGSLLFDLPITNSQYVNCTGESFNGRLFLAALSGSGSLDMTASITDCAFIGIRGKGSNRGMVIYNEDSTGVIADIDIIGCMIDCSDDVTSGNAAYINGQAGTGGVRDIRFKGWRIKSPYKEAMEISGVVDRVFVNGFRIDKPRTAGENTVDIKNVTSASFADGYMEANAADCFSVGSASNDANNVRIEGVTMAEIDDSKAGIRATASAGITSRSNKFIERSGQTSAFAIVLASGSSDSQIDPSDYSGITRSEKISMTAGNTQRNCVHGNTGTIIDATGATLRNYLSGTTYSNSGATAITPFVLSSAVPGTEYTFVVEDSDGIRVTANASDTITIGPTTSISGGKIESTTVGSVVHIKCLHSNAWYAISSTGTWTVT
jgi:hypothetical protein